jgi:hypothetical protein
MTMAVAALLAASSFEPAAAVDLQHADIGDGVCQFERAAAGRRHCSGAGHVSTGFCHACWRSCVGLGKSGHPAFATP